VVLEETAVAATHPSILCGECRASGLSLLPEHVSLAVSLAESSQQTRNDIIASLQSHLSPDAPDPAWPERALHTFASVAVLCATLRAHALEEDPSTAVSSVEFANELFAVLIRLPTNTHSVSAHKYGGHSATIQSIAHHRSGLALFMVASSLNHSCDPNCCVVIPPSISQSVVIRVVVIRPVTIGEELTVSYGPIWRRDPVLARQAALRAQYLFDCRCGSCEKDIARISSEAAAVERSDKATKALIRDSQLAFGRLTLRTQSLTPERAIAELLTYSGALKVAIKSQRNRASLDGYYGDRLTPLTCDVVPAVIRRLTDTLGCFELQELLRLLAKAYDQQAR
jgi:hypothetical protein